MQKVYYQLNLGSKPFIVTCLLHWIYLVTNYLLWHASCT